MFSSKPIHKLPSFAVFNRGMTDGNRLINWEFHFLGANQDTTHEQMNTDAHNAATASCSTEGGIGSARALSRKARAMQESMSPYYTAASNGGFMKPIDEVLGMMGERGDISTPLGVEFFYNSIAEPKALTLFHSPIEIYSF